MTQHDFSDQKRPKDSSNPSGASFMPILLLVVILLIAGSLRVTRAVSGSMAFDEIWHTAISTGNGSPQKTLPMDTLVMAPDATDLSVRQPPWRVWMNIERIIHPPLHHVALWFWRTGFGESDLAAQSLSIAASLIAIILLFVAGRRTVGTSAALWACLTIAMAPVEVFLHQQVRAYAMLQMFGLGCAGILLGIERSGASRLRTVSLGFCILLTLLCHYFAIGLVAAMFAYAAIRLRAADRRRVLGAMILAGVVFAIIWGPFMWKQRGDVIETADNWLKEQTPDHFVKTAIRLVELPARQLFDHPWLNEYAIYIGAVIWLAAAFTLWRREMRIWLFWLIGTFGFITLLDVFRSTTHLLYMRYTMLGLPAILLAACACMSRWNDFRRHIPGFAIAVLCALGLNNFREIAEEPDWRILGRFVQEQVEDAEPILYSSHGAAPWLSEVFYLASAHYSAKFPHPIAKLSRPADVALLGEIKSETAWVFTPFSQQPVDVRQVVPGAEILEQHAIAPMTIATQVRLPRQQ